LSWLFDKAFREAAYSKERAPELAVSGTLELVAILRLKSLFALSVARANDFSRRGVCVPAKTISVIRIRS